MSSRKRKAQWWQVYAMLPVMAALFVLEIRLPLTGTEHIIAQLGILFLVYGFIHLWLGANRRALMGLDAEPGTWQFKVYEIPPAELVQPQETGKHIFRLPDAGLKGVLSTTFEMDQDREQQPIPVSSEVLRREELSSAGNSKESRVR